MPEPEVLVAEVPVIEAPVEQPSASVALTPEGAQFAAILQRASVDPDFAKQPEVKEIVDKFNEVQRTAKPATENGLPENTTDTSVFYSKKNAVVEIKDYAEFQKVIEKDFGIQEVPVFLSSVQKWRSDSQELPDLQTKIEKLEGIFQDIPQELYEAMDTSLAGGDWREKISSVPPLDFTKEFKNQKAKAVQHYFGDRFKDADMYDETVKAAFDLAEEVSQQKFDIDKKLIEDRRVEIDGKAALRVTKLKQSAASSVENLIKTFPDFDPAQIKSVKNDLSADGIRSLFFNSDGSYKPDAAERYALAKFGKQEIQKIKAGASTAIGNRTLMDKIETNGKPKPVASGEAVRIPDGYTNLSKGLQKSSVYDSVPTA